MPEQEKAPQEPVLMLLFVEANSFEKLQNSVLKTWFLRPNAETRFQRQDSGGRDLKRQILLDTAMHERCH